ncbi:MAG: hypothetical protein KGL46_09980 [Hyphomicrobiales bacterium]|nr:hypothetical protein [Hyphomicrobiales bacterium]
MTSVWLSYEPDRGVLQQPAGFLCQWPFGSGFERRGFSLYRDALHFAQRKATKRGAVFKGSSQNLF